MKVVIDQTQKKLTGLDEPLPRDDDQLPSTLSLQSSVHWQTQIDNVFNHFTGCRKHQIDILNWKWGGACAECARMKMNWTIKITKNYISVHKNRQTNMFILILQVYVLHFKHTDLIGCQMFCVSSCGLKSLLWKWSQPHRSSIFIVLDVDATILLTSKWFKKSWP